MNIESIDLLATLSPREEQIAGMLMESNKAIAAVLGITPNTVKVHIAAAFSKTGVRNRVRLAMMMVMRERSKQ